MRRILIEHARARKASKRGGGRERVQVDDTVLRGPSRTIDVEALDEALDRLGLLDPRLVQIVELRFFGGLTIEETAQMLDVSAPTIKREWATARAWLRRELEG